MSWLLVPLVGSVLIWAASMRRAPGALAWLLASAVLAGLGALEIAAVMAEHPTLPGVAAIVVASVFPQLVCATGVEISRAVRPWGEEYRRRQGRSQPSARWSVITRAERLDDRTKTVWIGVRGDRAVRWIGYADPATDMDAFVELWVQAEQAAETLNALKVEG